ncbi:hypothetical protein RLIN73S_00310 [Rhodanobacter lindaniclasticus]
MLVCKKARPTLWSYSGKFTNTATRLRFCSTMHSTPSHTGSSHGSATALIAISMADRPLWLYQPTAIAKKLIATSPTRRSPW